MSAASAHRDRPSRPSAATSRPLRTSLRRAGRLREQGNPCRRTLAEVDGSLSKSRAAGNTWALGPFSALLRLGGPPPSASTAHSASGTYGFFKELALGNATTMTRSRSTGSASSSGASTAEALRHGLLRHCYRAGEETSLADKTAGLLPRVLRRRRGRQYPLARFLYVYVNIAPARISPPSCASSLSSLQYGLPVIVVQDGYSRCPLRSCRGAFQAEVGGEGRFNAPLTAENLAVPAGRHRLRTSLCGDS